MMSMQNKQNNLVKSLLDMWRNDYQFKTAASSALSALIGLGFTIFNGILGIIYHSAWHASICIYYVLLAVVRGIVSGVLGKDTLGKKARGNNEHRKVFIGTHIVMVFMDIALIFPIAYMVKGERTYEYGLIPAIVMAAYVTYRITMGIIHYRKARRKENLLVRELRTISLNDSMVALLTLQNALIIASGSEMRSMLQLTSGTSAAIWGAVVVITVISLSGIRNNEHT